MAKPNALQIEHLAVGQLQPYARNARKHGPKQIAQIAASIREFGFVNPVLIDREGVIIAGHGRVEAAKLLGLDTVPCVRLDHLTDAHKRAYIIADNRLAELAGWDRELLSIELQFLVGDEVEFEPSITGFEIGSTKPISPTASLLPTAIQEHRIAPPTGRGRRPESGSPPIQCRG